MKACALAVCMLAMTATSIAEDRIGNEMGKPKSTSTVLKQLKKAHEDLKGEKWADAIEKLKEADAVAGKNAYDQHLINDMLGFAYAHTQNYAEAAKAWEGELDDGFAPEKMPLRLRQLAEANYHLKNYDKAIEFGTRAIKWGGAGSQLNNLVTLVGQSYYLKEDWSGTQKFYDDLVRRQVILGEVPKKESLQLLYSACLKLQDPCAADALWLQFKYYPSLHVERLLGLSARVQATHPVRRDGPLREVNLSDEEVREIQAVGRGIVPDTLVNISGVVTGCPCEEGAGCSDQVWIVAYRPGEMRGLQLSRIGGRWMVGPVQQWWLRLDQIDAHRERYASLTDYYAAREKLYDNFPVCKEEPRPAPKRP